MPTCYFYCSNKEWRSVLEGIFDAKNFDLVPIVFKGNKPKLFNSSSEEFFKAITVNSSIVVLPRNFNGQLSIHKVGKEYSIEKNYAEPLLQLSIGGNPIFRVKDKREFRKYEKLSPNQLFYNNRNWHAKYKKYIPATSEVKTMFTQIKKIIVKRCPPLPVNRRILIGCDAVNLLENGMALLKSEGIIYEYESDSLIPLCRETPLGIKPLKA